MGPRVIPLLNRNKSAIPAMVSWAHWAVAEEAAHPGSFIYNDVRPLPLTDRLPLHLDCSFFIKWLVWTSNGLIDPETGYPFGAGSSWGNSKTLWAINKHVELPHLRIGDCITYGWNGSVHAVFVVETGFDPLCVSMGQPGDPHYVRNSVLCGLGTPTYIRINIASKRPVFAPKATR